MGSSPSSKFWESWSSVVTPSRWLSPSEISWLSSEVLRGTECTPTNSRSCAQTATKSPLVICIALKWVCLSRKYFFTRCLLGSLCLAERTLCLLYWFGPTFVYLAGLKVIFSFQTVLIIFLSCCVSAGKECTRKELTFGDQYKTKSLEVVMSWKKEIAVSHCVMCCCAFLCLEYKESTKVNCSILCLLECLSVFLSVHSCFVCDIINWP